MEFKTFGNLNKPVVVLIHAMFSSEEMFYSIVEALEKSYYLIIPILDGHSLNEHTTFLSVQDEVDKISEYLKKRGIQSVDIILGTSLGGIIAFELFIQKNFSISRAYLDGTPFFNLPSICIRIMAFLFKRIAHRLPKTSNSFLDKLYPAYSLKMKKICENMNDESITNLAKACYSYKLPKKINLNSGQRLTFIYSSKEIASMCIPMLKKYNNSDLIVKKGYSHCEFLAKDPKAYMEILLNNEEKIYDRT